MAYKIYTIGTQENVTLNFDTKGTLPIYSETNSDIYSYDKEYWIENGTNAAQIIVNNSPRSIGYNGLLNEYCIRPAILFTSTTSFDIGSYFYHNSQKFIVISKTGPTNSNYTYSAILSGDIGSSAYVSNEIETYTDDTGTCTYNYTDFYKDENAYNYNYSTTNKLHPNLVKRAIDAWYAENFPSTT